MSFSGYQTVQILINAAFYLGLHYLQKYPFKVFQSTKAQTHKNVILTDSLYFGRHTDKQLVRWIVYKTR